VQLIAAEIPDQKQLPLSYLKKKHKRNSVGSKITDFCIGHIQLASSSGIEVMTTKLAVCREKTKAIMMKVR